MQADALLNPSCPKLYSTGSERPLFTRPRSPTAAQRVGLSALSVPGAAKGSTRGALTTFRAIPLNACTPPELVSQHLNMDPSVIAQFSKARLDVLPA